MSNTLKIKVPFDYPQAAEAIGTYNHKLIILKRELEQTNQPVPPYIDAMLDRIYKNRRAENDIMCNMIDHPENKKENTANFEKTMHDMAKILADITSNTTTTAIKPINHN